MNSDEPHPTILHLTCDRHLPEAAARQFGTNGRGREGVQDKYLRPSAEFDNYRKRTLKEKMTVVTGCEVM